jgi:hypothetical protein
MAGNISVVGISGRCTARQPHDKTREKGTERREPAGQQSMRFKVYGSRLRVKG